MRSTASRGNEVEGYLTAEDRLREFRGVGYTTLGQKVVYFQEHEANAWRRGHSAATKLQRGRIHRLAGERRVTAGLGSRRKRWMDVATGLDEFKMRQQTLTVCPASAIRRAIPRCLHICLPHVCWASRCPRGRQAVVVPVPPTVELNPPSPPVLPCCWPRLPVAKIVGSGVAGFGILRAPPLELLFVSPSRTCFYPSLLTHMRHVQKSWCSQLAQFRSPSLNPPKCITQEDGAPLPLSLPYIFPLVVAQASHDGLGGS